MTIQLLLAALVPPLLILLWLNRRGRPWWTVGLALLLGGVCAEAAGFFEELLTKRAWSITSFGMLFLFTTIVAGMVEECCKYAAFRVGPARTRWFREEYDGVLFVTAVSLGFAAWENIGYVRQHGMDTALLRAYTAIPAHAACGVIMGSYVGRARVRELAGWDTRGLVGTGLLLAIFVHGLYDMLAFSASPVADWSLYALLLIMVVASIRMANAAHARSASFGGVASAIPDAATSVRQAVQKPLPERDERLSAVLGLVPGLGQAFNGEYRKAAIFAGILTLNGLLYYALYTFVTDPGYALAKLASWGMALAADEKQIISLVQQGQTMLNIMLGVIGAWIVYSGLDAWLTARRSARLEGLDVSYLVHVGLVLLVVLVPFLTGGGGSGNGSEKKDGKDGNGGVEVTWVETPAVIGGWNPGSEGHGDGKGEETSEQRDEPKGEEGQSEETQEGTDNQEATTQPSEENGEVGVPSTTGPARQKKRGQARDPQEKKQYGDPKKSEYGTKKSYNDYLSARLHQPAHQQYFQNTPEEIWTIVHYRIAGDGTLLEISVVETNGTARQAQYAVDAVSSLVPLAPVPGNPRAIDVTELFWRTDSTGLPPGSLAQRLAELPDGRLIKIEP